MSHASLHPTRFGFFLGIAALALWALVWFWVLAALLRGPQRDDRGQGSAPEIAALSKLRPNAQANVRGQVAESAKDSQFFSRRYRLLAEDFVLILA